MVFCHIAVDQMNAQSLVLAQLATQYGVDTQHGKDPNAAAAQAIKAQLIQAQKDLASITAQKAQVRSLLLTSCELFLLFPQVCQHAKRTGLSVVKVVPKSRCDCRRTRTQLLPASLQTSTSP